MTGLPEAPDRQLGMPPTGRRAETEAGGFGPASAGRSPVGTPSPSKAEKLALLRWLMIQLGGPSGKDGPLMEAVKRSGVRTYGGRRIYGPSWHDTNARRSQ